MCHHGTDSLVVGDRPLACSDAVMGTFECVIECVDRREVFKFPYCLPLAEDRDVAQSYLMQLQGDAGCSRNRETVQLLRDKLERQARDPAAGLPSQVKHPCCSCTFARRPCGAQATWLILRCTQTLRHGMP